MVSSATTPNVACWGNCEKLAASRHHPALLPSFCLYNAEARVCKPPTDISLSYFSCEETPWSRQLIKKAFSWRFAYRFSSWSSWWEASQHCARAVAESFTFWSIGRETELSVGVWNLKAHPQWHTVFNKATPPNPPQVFYQLGAKAFKHISLCMTFDSKDYIYMCS